MSKPFYITTTLPYVNGKPHLGYALEACQADVLARMARLRGDEIVFNIGTDEHGQKIFRKAEEEGVTPQEYCDRMSQYFRVLRETLDIGYTHFIRTTDPHHVAAAQEFWRRCEANGDIYKKSYQAKYCVGCEMEKTDSELDHGRCPEHPNMEIQIIEEENYFFRFSKYQDVLLSLYERKDFIVPTNRLSEIRSFVSTGLRDFSISRLASKMPWGIPVPGDEEHVMYVWFDALVNYISTLGWPAEGSDFERFWPGLQIAGKDNLRPQSAMWQAMLLSAGIEPSRQILIHGFVLSKGQKMSKSLGNVISPEELSERFGKDGTRYLLLSSGNLENDPDVTLERLTEKYNADLANGLGNLVSRVMRLSEGLDQDSKKVPVSPAFPDDVANPLENYRFAEALEKIWETVRDANRYIEEEKPWELAKTDREKFHGVMSVLLDRLAFLSVALVPFLPDTAEKIRTSLESGTTEILFQRVKMENK
ncbi:MAG: methionine--tRNA ligase [Candidatus Moraniibacteriota bacterium]